MHRRAAAAVPKYKNSAIRAILVQSDGPELKICRNLSVARLTN